MTKNEINAMSELFEEMKFSAHYRLNFEINNLSDVSDISYVYGVLNAYYTIGLLDDKEHDYYSNQIKSACNLKFKDV